METGELELRKFLAPEFVFGVGARHHVGRYAKNFGARTALVVTDPGVLQAGWTADVIASLDSEGIASSVFSGVSPNPREEEVAAGAEQYQRDRCNVIVAVGGGSPIDCAKGVGIVVSNRRPIGDFEGVDRVTAPMPPLICVPTTGGTSADVSQFAIISRPADLVKFAIVSKAVVPDVSLIDPLTLTTMPARLAACTAVDALVHAIEAYVSNAHSPMTDVHALEAIRLISENLVASIERPADVSLKAKVMQGSLQAGLAFSNASLGAVHAMAHSLGGLLDLPHGEANALLLERVMAFNFPQSPERYEHAGRAMGLELGGMGVRARRNAVLRAIEGLRRAAGIEETLRSKGVNPGHLPDLARKALKDPCIVTNPRRPTQRDLEVVYEEAL